MSDFVFEECDLTQEEAQRQIDGVLKGADDGELFVERSVSESLTFDDGRLKNASFDSSRGFGLRCVAGEMSGFAQSTNLTSSSLSRAASSVAMVKDGYDGSTAATPARTNVKLYDDFDPTDNPVFALKVELLQEIDTYCRALDSSVVQVSVTMSGNRRAISIMRSGGERYDDIRPLVRLNISITAEKNGRRENGYAGAGGRQTYD